MDINERAKKLAGNWQKFGSFCWTNEPEIDSQNWCIVYTHNRDSTLLDQSNADVIKSELKQYIGDNLQVEDHNHWACGWVKGYSIKVYDNGIITDAFKAWHDIQNRLENYPVLDDSDYYEREYLETLDGIKQSAHDNDYNLTDEQIHDVYNWFENNNQSAIESKDDTGGYPDDAEIEAACSALGIKKD